MKTILITEAQKKKLKKAIAAQDQVGGKVNAGIMDVAAYGGGGMCEEKEPIQEAAVDLEYHYTSLRNLISMMYTDTFNLSDNTEKYLQEPGRVANYFMSLTRMRNSAEGYGNAIVNSDESPVIRIELDGRKLNNIRSVDIRPYDYFYHNWDGGFGMTRLVRGRQGGDATFAEAEDSLSLKNGKDQIVDAIDYVNRIDILLKPHVTNIKMWDKFLNMFDTYKDWAQKMHFFVNLNDFNYQRNEIPSSKIYSIYSEQMKYVALSENVEQETMWNGEGDEFKYIKPTTIPKVLYHATYRKNRESILNNGLLPSAGEEYSGWWDYSGPNGEQPDGIDELPELIFLSEDPYGWARHYYLYTMDIYKVDVSKLNTDKLFKDPTKSLNDCYCYSEQIPPSAIELYDFVYKGKSRKLDDPEFESVSKRYFDIGENIEDDTYKLGAENGMSPNYHVIKEAKNDKGETVPKKCDKCGGDVALEIHGEPIYVCKKCGKYFGTMPCTMDENISTEIVNPEDVDLSSFNIQKQLNPKLWVNGKLDSEIRIKLLDIADDFIDFLGIDFGEPDDIIMTGSLANYNWNGKYSDIDLHILVDYEDFGDNYALIDDYFYAKKSLWNERHKDINIYGYPVELFVQDIHEKHFSSGVYSLEKDRWIIEPDREILTSSKVNKEFIKERISDYMNKIDKLEYIYKKIHNDSYKLEKLYNKADKLFDRIKSERKIGFEKSGGKELNNFNIIFKGLRRNSYIEKLVNLKNEIYDKLKSLN